MAFLPKQKSKDISKHDGSAVYIKVTGKPTDEEIDLMDRELLKQWCVYFGYTDDNIKGKTIKELREMLKGL